MDCKKLYRKKIILQYSILLPLSSHLPTRIVNVQLSQKLISISSQASTMNISPSVLATFAVLSSSGVWVSVKIRTMMWKSLLSLSCTLLRFFSSEKKTSGVPNLMPAKATTKQQGRNKFLLLLYILQSWKLHHPTSAATPSDKHRARRQRRGAVPHQYERFGCRRWRRRRFVCGPVGASASHVSNPAATASSRRRNATAGGFHAEHGAKPTMPHSSSSNNQCHRHPTWRRQQRR